VKKSKNKPIEDVKKHISSSIIKQLNLDETHFTRYHYAWWQNPRPKKTGGLRLTLEGYEAFQNLGVEEHSIDFPHDTEFTGQLVLWLDRFIDCPFYLEKKRIIVFSDNVAVQLILFSGNIQKYGLARAKAVAKKQQQEKEAKDVDSTAE